MRNSKKGEERHWEVACMERDHPMYVFNKKLIGAA